MPAPRTTAELDHIMTEPPPGVLECLEGLPGPFGVLGAGGKMGLHVTQMLDRACRHGGRAGAVTAVSRFGSPDARAPFKRAGIPTLSADLSNPEDLDRLPDFEGLIFLAGVKFGTQNQPELLEQMNVRMPRLVASRYRTSRIVALSTGCVYSFQSPELGGSTEDQPTDPPGDYARSCLGREEAFREAAEQWGTRSTLIRLNYSIDLRYGVLVDLAQKVLAEEPISVEMGYVNIIWQGDAVAHILQALPWATAPPCVLNVTGAEVLAVRDLAHRLGQLLGKPVQLIGQEQPTAWLSNPSRAHQLFGPPRVSVEQMLEWTAHWVTQGGETWNKPTHFEARDGQY